MSAGDGFFVDSKVFLLSSCLTVLLSYFSYPCSSVFIRG
jgi:hypothetical protein